MSSDVGRDTDIGGGGENTTAVNIGTGAGLFASKVEDELQFKSLKAGTNITLTPSATEILIDGSAMGEDNLGANVGSGAGLIFRDKIGVTLNFKSLIAGTNITITNNADDITIDSTGGGEVNTASNLGGGDGVFAQKNGVDLEFKSLVAGTNITLTPSATEILIDAAGGGGEINLGANVGSGTGLIFRDKTGVTLNFKSLIAGTGIGITNNADDIEIEATGVVTSFFAQSNNNDVIPDSTVGVRFLALNGLRTDGGVENTRQFPMPNAATFARLTINISLNGTDNPSFFKFRINGADGNQALTIGTSLTGSFQDLSNTDVTSNLDLVNYSIQKGVGDDMEILGNSIEVTT